jgi:hypothetical protein
MNSEFSPLTDFHYEEKVIAFLDVLGWRKLVERSVNDEILRQHMTLNINMVRNMTVGNKYSIEQRPENTPTQIIQFSDSIVISSDSTTEGVQGLLFQVQFLIGSFFLPSFFIRGGITKGQLLHRDSIIFGPALIRAYDLESTIARYPRVIIDPEQMDFFSTIVNTGGFNQILDFVNHDDDISFVNILKPHPSGGKGAAFHMESAHRMISRLLTTENQNEQMEPNVKSKINWFINYYNASLARYPEAEGYEGKPTKLALLN